MLAALVAFCSGCAQMGTLPLGDELMTPEEAWSRPVAGERPGRSARPRARSVLLKRADLERVVRDFLPDCDRVLLSRSRSRETLLGFRKGNERPQRMASLTPVGDRSGSLVLAVGLERWGDRTFVRRVDTLAPRGRLWGMKTYLTNRSAFLNRLSDGLARHDSARVDAITGATSISNAVAATFHTEAKALHDLMTDPARLKEVAAKARTFSDSEIAPVAGRTSAEPEPIVDDMVASIDLHPLAKDKATWTGPKRMGSTDGEGSALIYGEALLLGLAMVLVGVSPFFRRSA